MASLASGLPFGVSGDPVSLAAALLAKANEMESADPSRETLLAAVRALLDMPIARPGDAPSSLARLVEGR